MRRLLGYVSFVALLYASAAMALEQFTADPVPSASSPFISNQFMQLTTVIDAPLRLHTGIDIATGGGVAVTCPIASPSDCSIANDLSNPSQAHMLLMHSRYPQGGDRVLMQVVHIDRDPSITQSTVLHAGQLLGTVTAVDAHLHAEIFLTPSVTGGMTLDPYLVHPQLYGFSEANRWNVDTRAPVVDGVVVHPGVPGSPTVFEIRAHDQADADPRFYNGIYELRLYVDDDLVDDVHFDQMCGGPPGYPCGALDYYYAADSIPVGYNNPNVLRYKLSWNTVAGGHIGRIDVLDAKGNLLHGDPVNGLPGRYVPAVALKATLDGDHVRLSWHISPSDLDWAGIESFELWQFALPAGDGSLMTATPIAATPEVEDYSFVADAPTEADSVGFQLVGRTTLGGRLDLGLTTLPVARPVYALLRYPNPVANYCTIALSLAEADAADVWILDLEGRRVRTVHQGPLAAGLTRLLWDGRDDGGRPLANGVYLLRVHTRRESGLRAQKIVLFR